ncbi:hypothetical protein QWY86_06160 [Pedobacter aquatilis]|uniref:hypothetical protein n=1 Tax=Pedobacter aquatilis TaxID=351343 RepID=UPI0025B42EDD|nr:hypothetical protein [Pedobacter aquatilis]MDN3586242.1 hypothetical protein [Pedobacter aquatilis]
MKAIVNGLKSLLGTEVKDLFQYSKTEINIMIFSLEDLDWIYTKTTQHILGMAEPYTLVRINFINDKEEVLKSFDLLQ